VLDHGDLEGQTVRKRIKRAIVKLQARPDRGGSLSREKT
jgi:hypothetical protein